MKVSMGTWIPTSAIVAQGERRIGIAEAGGETIRLEEHAFGHLPTSALHRRAKDAECQLSFTQVRGNRQTVWACSDDDKVNYHRVYCRSSKESVPSSYCASASFVYVYSRQVNNTDLLYQMYKTKYYKFLIYM
jgi:hypothetical protein